MTARRQENAAATIPGRGADLLELQLQYGNQYVTRLVQQFRQDAAVRGVAASGLRGAGRPLPHADRVQQALGPHRLDEVRAYTDTAARAGCRDLGAEAYTIGNKIAFASASPDLRTVAHEAVHAIQQQAGERGDYLERRAEAAADAIEHGRSPTGFLPEPGGRGGSVTPAVQARVSVREPQSFLGSLFWSPQPPQALQTPRELADFLRQHGVAIGQIARSRYAIAYSVLPKLLNVAGRRMIGDSQDRVYDNNKTGAQELADAVVDEAYGFFGLGSEQASERSPFSASHWSPELRYPSRTPARSTWTFDQLSGLAAAVPLPEAVGDYGSQQVRAKIAEHTPENPVREGVEEAFTGRVEAMTRRPQDPRKALDVLPWADYYFNAGGAEDLQRTVDIAASKMSREEAQKFKEDFEKLKFDQEMKAAASAGTSIAVGQGIGLIPHPAAQAVRIGWTVTGGVAANNKLGDVSDKLHKLEEDHPKAFQVMQEHRDQKLAELNAQRRERSKKINQDVMEHVTSPWG
jgi:hypothetical protein